MSAANRIADWLANRAPAELLVVAGVLVMAAASSAFLTVTGG